MALSAISPLTRQDPYPKIVDIGSRRAASEESQPVYDNGYAGPTEDVDVSAPIGVSTDGEPIDARTIVRVCGGMAAAVYAVLDSTDRAGEPTTYLDLEETFGLSRRQVRYLVASLVEHGFARVEKGGGRGNESVITPITTPSNRAENSATKSAQDCTETPQTVQKTVQLGGLIGGQTVTATESGSENELTPKGGAGGKRGSSTKPKSDDDDDPETDEFKAFAKAYPRKKNREAAWRAWQKLNPSDRLIGRIMDALAAQKQQPKWLDGVTFIPYPATWLNGKQWRNAVEMDEEPQIKPKFKSQADHNSPGKFVQ